MKLPRRRSSRPRGRGRLDIAGDFPDTGESVTEILERVRPADWDGTTIFTGASGAGLPDGGIYGAPARDHSVALQGGTMTVYADAPGIPMDTRLRRARDFIELEVADLKAQGMLYRVDDAEKVRERGEDLDERSVVAVTVAKAVRHLMGAREPWDPR